MITRSVSPLTKLSLPCLMAGAAAIALAIGAGGARAQEYYQLHPSARNALLLPAVQGLAIDDGCPDGWVPSSQPGGCSPGSLTSRPEPPYRLLPRPQVYATPDPGILCPEGSVPATPPLNPQLGCLPNTIAQ